MPGSKAQTPAPIDRPLSRAYLREFSGWSTAYPPGVSEPTSLRLMENVMINRDGSCRVRPGLRFASYAVIPDTDAGVPGTSSYPITSVIGTHETFFLDDGTKAYLYAVSEADNTVGFRVLQNTGNGQIERTLDDVGFTIPQGEAAIKFTSATTYVKYLQIDNKIFALSNAGETMRMFFVGEEKIAKRLDSIERPKWDVDDKLTVVHPDASWINSGIPTGVRTNLEPNPSFENGKSGWGAGNELTELSRSDAFARNGGFSLRVGSMPSRTNLVKNPLNDPATNGIVGWYGGTGADDSDPTLNSGALRIHLNDDASSGLAYCKRTEVEPNTAYRAALDGVPGGYSKVDEIRIVIRYFDANDNKIGNDHEVSSGNGVGNTNITSVTFTTPSGCATLRVCAKGIRDGSGNAYFGIKNVRCMKRPESTTMFSGDSGTNYFWAGTAGDSVSYYHPPQDVAVSSFYLLGAGTYTKSIYARAGSTVRNVQVDMYSGPAGTVTPTVTDAGTPTADVTGGWQRVTNTMTAIAGTAWVTSSVVIAAVPRGEYHYLDSSLLEEAGSALTYFDGSFSNSSGVNYEWTGDAHDSPSTESTYSGGLTIPGAETKTANTLIDSTKADNAYSVGMFYTFANEVGESAVSQVTVVRVQRPWSGWLWETPNGSGEPSGTSTSDPAACADQLVASMSSDVFADAIASGAIKWSLYAFTWSDQDPTPVTAVKVDSRSLTAASVHGAEGWLRMTPAQAEASAETSIVPTKRTRFNSSDPSRAGQGVVASDRMVMVFDPTDQAVIKWSSNQQGSYFDFSPSKGGGYKTLTSGNLQVPAAVKLWQNPQSADTITILCLGVDGYSTAYYMAPAQIASQSEAVNIMAFEETTATPGTCSPYGVEVFNNALYHPIEEQLMKSVASNYNINHSSLSDMIENVWRTLSSKNHIVSCQLDNRLYYLVHNPAGETLKTGCWGNEVWVLDAAQKQGSWSRWLTQGQSLRKIEQNGRIVMSLIHPSGIFYFDEQAVSDEYVDDDSSEILDRPIPWLLETNTQGANRAHDAWARLEQANVVFGNFQGQARYGIRGLDIHGKWQQIEKIFRDNNAPGNERFDVEDFLLIRKDMKEWFFFASSITEDDEVFPSSGQISLVQYRYTPSSVNTGYEFGSIETFEYGRSGEAGATTDNGVPMPYIDTRRP